MAVSKLDTLLYEAITMKQVKEKSKQNENEN